MTDGETLKEIAKFNPSRQIGRGTLAPFVDMAALPTNGRDIRTIAQREYQGGGSKFKNGDTLFARITPCLENGKTAKMSGLKSGDVAHGSTEFIVISAKEPEYDEDFIYYLARLPEFRAYAEKRMEGTSGRQRVSWQSIEAFSLELPDKYARAEIGRVLSSIDDKIELNQRMNETLEAMAKALFKSWFVDFDPVRAKAEGRKPECMDAVTAALFPATFNDDGLPQGWDKVPFSGLIEIIGGGTPKTSIAEYWNGTIPWFSVVDAPADTDIYVIDTEKKITQVGVDNSSTKVLPVGTTIISARGTVGRVALVGAPMAMNQSCYGIRGNNGLPDYFTYFCVRQLVAELKARSHGSVFDTITRETFDSVSFVKPNKKIAVAFDGHISSIMQKVLNNLHESKTLSGLRDALLPKLISGELRIDVAQQGTEEAAGKVVAFPQKTAKSSGKANEQFQEAVLVAGIVRGWGNQQYPLGSFRLQKAAYLVRRKADHDTSAHRRHAAGPYNPDMKYKGGIGIAKKNSYVQEHTNGKFKGLIAGDAIDAINGYMPRYDFGDALAWVLKTFQYKTKDELELLTTVDDAAQELRAEGKAVSADAIIAVIKNEPTWAEKLEKPFFSKAHIEKAIAELAQLFPEQGEE